MRKSRANKLWAASEEEETGSRRVLEAVQSRRQIMILRIKGLFSSGGLTIRNIAELIQEGLDSLPGRLILATFAITLAWFLIR
jgi:hypothetical protein